AATADGKTLLSAAGLSDARVRRWDVKDGKELPEAPFELPTHTQRAERMATAFSPGGRFLAWAGRETGLTGRAARAVPAVRDKDGKVVPLRPLPQPREIIEIVETASGKTVQSFEI